MFKAVRSRLEKSGFEIVAEPGSGLRHKVGFQGQIFANLHCVPVHSGVDLSVWVSEIYHPVTGMASFSKMFGLNCTESPRRAAALIVKFLRKAIVKLVHKA